MRSSLFFLCLVIPASSLSRAALVPGRTSSLTGGADHRIRVRLAEAAPKVEIRGYDLRISESRKTEKQLANKADRLTEWELRCQRGRVRLTAKDGGKMLDLAEPVTLETPAGFLSFRGRPYRDIIRVHSSGSLCEVVNELDLEKYLDGLVNAEFSAKWPEPAIAAQVVAARTYALHQIRVARADTDQHYDVDATVRDQVYDGSVREDFRASRAVEKTSGMVLVPAVAASGTGRRPSSAVGTQEPAPLKAFYHSTCGGMTELPEQVWGRNYPGFRQAVKCPFCSSSPRFKWSLDLDAREVADALLRGAGADGTPAGWPAGWSKTLKSASLIDIRVARYNSEGRVADLLLSWSSGRTLLELRVPAPRFRDWIGPGRLRSTSFSLLQHRTVQGTRWHFDGRGNGHGVGMCQWGAKVMGEKGYSLSAILSHYYPGARLVRLW